MPKPDLLSPPMPTKVPSKSEREVIAATRNWLERAVIGLDLCPFAKAVHAKQQIRYVVSRADQARTLLPVLIMELRTLAAADPAMIETTLLIHPQVLTDFLDFNDFLEVADGAINNLGLSGILQVASFHPDYQFAGTLPDDIENYTNRAPYPTLHLLREESVARAVAAIPDAAQIFKRNIATLRRIGPQALTSHGFATPAKTVADHAPAGLRKSGSPGGRPMK